MNNTLKHLWVAVLGGLWRKGLRLHIEDTASYYPETVKTTIIESKVWLCCFPDSHAPQEAANAITYGMEKSGLGREEYPLLAEALRLIARREKGLGPEEPDPWEEPKG